MTMFPAGFFVFVFGNEAVAGVLCVGIGAEVTSACIQNEDSTIIKITWLNLLFHLTIPRIVLAQHGMGDLR